MKKFRQYIKESKAYPLGVPTHFAHSDNRNVHLKEDDYVDPNHRLIDVINKHLDSRPANPHLETQPNDNYTGSVKHTKLAQSVADKLEDHYNYDHVPHHGAVRKYTKCSTAINKALYEGSVIHGHSHEDLAKHNDYHFHINELDKAVNHHTLKHDLTVFSGVTNRVPNDAAKHPDRLLHHPGYVSTSLSAHTASGFTKLDHNGNHHILRIHLKAGHKMLPVLSHSNYDNEREVILPRGHTFKLADKPETHEIDSGWGDGKKHKVHIWDAHIHHEAPINEK